MQEPIYVAGHRGMVGSAVLRRLNQNNVQTVTRSRTELDLCDQAAVRDFFRDSSIGTVIFCAARVGGIHANNTYPAEFCYQNIQMATNAIHAAYEAGVQRLLFLGSTCIYPRDCKQPIQESSLLTGTLEQTNEAYALAKIAGLKMCQFYRRQYGVLFHSAMPTNLYGPGDNYHPENSHVLPALIRRFHEAKEQGRQEVTIWGTGTPRREFLHVDDLADALVYLLELEDPPDWVNVGTGKDVPIQGLAQMVAKTVGYEGKISNDTSKPDGTPVKCTDMTLLNDLGWSARIDLAKGLQTTYESFLKETEVGVIRSL